MNYQVVTALPGYLRLRAPRFAISEDDSYILSHVIGQMSAVLSVDVNYLTGSILVRHCGNNDSLVTAIEAINLDECPPVPLHEQDQHVKIGLTFKGMLSKTFMARFLKGLMPMPVYKALTVYSAIRYVWRGLKSLGQGRFDVDVLDGAAIGLSVAFGHYHSASSIMFLLSISDILEEYARQRTRNALTTALIMNVDTVWVRLEDGLEVQKSISDVQVGDEIIVRAGTMIPLDGEIVSGEAGVNQQTLTGESAPVVKQVGDSVYAGTAVAEGELVIRVRKLLEESRIQYILNMVERAEDEKIGTAAKAEALADRIVPYSFLFAGIVWLLTRDGHKALSALTVDYSCAIKLATPLAVISAMREATQNRIMIKGGKYLEAMAEADTIVFDKTGTLTCATPKVKKVIPLTEEMNRDDVLRLAACLEEHFPHSLARAIVLQAEEEGLKHREEHADVKYVVAHGIESEWRNQTVRIGSRHFLEEDKGIVFNEAAEAAIHEEGSGFSCVYLAVADSLVGFICIQDPPREEAKEVIRGLRQSGIKNIVMLTGDGAPIAQRIADELGIDRYFAEVLPEDKASKVQELQAEGKKVIMVGDGVNDTPALAQADVSVSLRDASDVAREVADITLLQSDLSALVTARHLGLRLMRRIDSNFNRIFTINTGLLILGATGVMQPTSTALWHNVSTAALGYAACQPLLSPRERKAQQALIE
ncbi:heavy metal translocating P-type ATPase [Peptococcus simiae]|uniref:heavy metal translocating P-type ATPase n=1 Tax=Peptococcus simiae TaxID=1643805 RepID=UPI003980E38F